MSEARAYTPKVTVVPATLNRFTAAPIHSTRKRRVAAYARVSTNDEEQANSYEAQVSHLLLCQTPEGYAASGLKVQ